MWYENLQADDHTDLLRCHWLCFGFDPQMRVHFEGVKFTVIKKGGWRDRKGRVVEQMEFYL